MLRHLWMELKWQIIILYYKFCIPFYNGTRTLACDSPRNRYFFSGQRLHLRIQSEKTTSEQGFSERLSSYGAIPGHDPVVLERASRQDQVQVQSVFVCLALDSDRDHLHKSPVAGGAKVHWSLACLIDLEAKAVRQTRKDEWTLQVKKSDQNTETIMDDGCQLITDSYESDLRREDDLLLKILVRGWFREVPTMNCINSDSSALSCGKTEAAVKSCDYEPIISANANYFWRIFKWNGRLFASNYFMKFELNCNYINQNDHLSWELMGLTSGVCHDSIYLASWFIGIWNLIKTIRHSNQYIYWSQLIGNDPEKLDDTLRVSRGAKERVIRNIVNFELISAKMQVKVCFAYFLSSSNLFLGL